MKNRKLLIFVFSFLMFVIMITRQVRAEETVKETKWNMGSVVNTGKDNGFSGKGSIKKDDPHYGWALGQFYIEGYSGRKVDENGNPIFLKNIGDEIRLMFDLQQNIKKLNGNKDLYIHEDTNGYMEKYQIEKTNLKKGTLVIRHTDYQNNVGEPQIYTNYLASKDLAEADTEVLLCEEGDYEVCLVYEIMNDGFLFFNGYTNYKIEFKFSVRNGNTMIFPFDTETGQELANSSFTENGFYLDLANSHYLTIQVKREVLTKSGEEWIRDVRFNRVVSDGEKYTEEGIYTITVTNPYTDAITDKVIYVGDDSLLKAHVVTGLSLNDIESQIAEGATIDEEGNIVPLSVTKPDLQETQSEKKDETEKANESEINKWKNDYWILTGISFIIFIGCVIVYILVKKKKESNNQEDIVE